MCLSPNVSGAALSHPPSHLPAARLRNIGVSSMSKILLLKVAQCLLLHCLQIWSILTLFRPSLAAMEAAGLILGVLPLVVSTIEHYDFFAPFICHCAFMRELQNFRRKLDARKLLFRNECRLLLEVLVQEELIEEMFREGSTHPSWTDMDLNERVRLYLGESHEACVDMMAAIEDCIDQLRQKTQGLSAVLSPKADVCRLL